MNKKMILKICISAILLAILLATVDFRDFSDSIKNVNMVFFLIGLSSTIPGILISTYKWQILLHAKAIKDVSFMRLWVLYYVGMFFNNFLPSEVGGDVIRSYNVGKISGRHTESLAAVAMERITGLIAVVIYGVFGIFLNWTLASNLQLIKIGFGSLTITACFIVLLFHRGFALWVQKKIEVGPIKKIVGKIKSFYLSLADYKQNLQVLVTTLILSVVFQFIAIATIYFFLIAIDINISMTQLILIVPMITLVGIIPIGINGIGLREGAFVFLFSQIGIPPAQSFTVSIFYRICTLLPSILGGIFYAFYKDAVEKVEKSRS